MDNDIMEREGIKSPWKLHIKPHENSGKLYRRTTYLRKEGKLKGV